jgi:DNA-binding NarL/FixJ family response regulator
VPEEDLAMHTRVMLVDDQTDFRRLMEALLRRQADLEVVAQAGSLAEARSHATTVRFDVAVLDLGLPDGTGADLIAELRRANPSVAVLILSANLNPKSLEKAIQAGADEILDKFATPGEVLSAIRRIRTAAAADTV